MNHIKAAQSLVRVASKLLATKYEFELPDNLSSNDDQLLLKATQDVRDVALPALKHFGFKIEHEVQDDLEKAIFGVLYKHRKGLLDQIYNKYQGNR